MNFPKNCIYYGTLMHDRLIPKRHKFAYKLFYLFFDLSQLDVIKKKFTFFSYNKINFFSFYDKDHGYRNKIKTISWVKNILKKVGLNKKKIKIYILCMPRILGHVFNPLTIYFCYDVKGSLKVIIYEVKNTFDQQHSYVFKLKNFSNANFFNHSCVKKFHVSPFWGMNAKYNFKVSKPSNKFYVSIGMRKKNKKIFEAILNTKYQKLSFKNFILKFFQYPFLTIKVVLAIHIEALKIFFKGGKYFKKPLLKNDLTIVNN